MNDKRLWTVGGVLFVVAAIVSLVSGSTVMGIAFIAVGLSFLAMPAYLDRGRRR